MFLILSMSRQVFKYTKKILKKVTFSFHLFKKELKKASLVLLPHEYEELKIWVENYINKHPHLVGVL